MYITSTWCQKWQRSIEIAVPNSLEGLLGHAAPIPLRPEFGSAEFQALQPPEMWSLETQAPNGQKILEETEEMSKKWLELELQSNLACEVWRVPGFLESTPTGVTQLRQQNLGNSSHFPTWFGRFGVIEQFKELSSGLTTAVSL
jgi:hypothetical protein